MHSDKRPSRYLRRAPLFTLRKDPKSGIYAVKFALDGRRYSRSTQETNERAAQAKAQDMRDAIWREWLQGQDLAKSSSSPPVEHSPFEPRPAPNMEVEIQKSSTPLVNGNIAESGMQTSPPMAAIPQNSSNVVIDAALEQFLTYYRNDEERGKKTESSVMIVRGYIRTCMKGLGCHYLSDITEEKLIRRRNELESTHAKKTVQGVIVYTKKFLRWCKRKRYLHVDPIEFWIFRKGAEYRYVPRDYNEIKNQWTLGFFTKFVGDFEKRDQEALWLYWHTGLDLCDIARIEEANIKDFGDGKYLVIRRLKAKDKSESSREMVRFPLQNERGEFKDAGAIIMRALKTAKEQGRQFLFRSAQDTNPILFSRRITNRRLYLFEHEYSLKVKAMGRNLTFKALRHQFITRCVQAGVPMTDLQRWVGHTNTKMIEEIYNHHIQTAGSLDKLDRPQPTYRPNNLIPFGNGTRMTA